MLTKPFKPLALAFLVNLIISVEDKIKYKVVSNAEGASTLGGSGACSPGNFEIWLL